MSSRYERGSAARAWALVMVAVATVFSALVPMGCQSSGNENPFFNDGADGGPTGASPEVKPCGRKPGTCQAGTVCDPLQGCVQCLHDDDCAPTEWCDDRQCVDAVSCDSSADCESSDTEYTVCHPAFGRCVRCTADSDCGKDGRCREGRCESVEPCVNSFDCTEGLVCDRQTKTCVDCTGNGDCTGTDVCFNNECVTNCESDSECLPENRLCNLDFKSCVQCVENLDCPEEYFCDRGKCFLDVCREGQSRCGPEAGTILACSPEGNTLNVSSCDARSSCVESGDNAHCRSWVCTPGDTRCNSAQTAVEVCQDDGMGFEVLDPCGDTGICLDGACEPLQCPPGQTFCNENGLIAECNATGTTVVSAEPCPSGNYCDADQNACVPNVCTPGSSSCDGDTLRTCNAAGSGFDSDTTDCSAQDATCVEGECLDIVCTPGATSCNDNNEMVTCNATGTGTFSSPCSFGYACEESSGSASCKLVSCTPGSPQCDGNVLTTCNALGTGLDSGGTDCADSGQVCVNGECKPVICQGTSVCYEGSVYACTDKGSTRSLSRTCSSSSYCDESGTSATCRAQLCSPDQAGCDGNVVSTCKSDGSGWTHTGADCSASDQVCVSAACLPVICEASQRFCDGGNVFTCGPKGATSSLYSTCSASYYCDDSGSYATCRPDVCTAGNPTCRGDFVATCKSDGSGPEETGGTDCSTTGQTCESGQCKDIVCEASKRFCQNGHVDLCNATGTASSRYDTCATAEYCDPTGAANGQAACSPDVCDAGAASCDGERPTVCLDDGSGYETGGAACASNQVCTAAAVCATTATDTVGTGASSSSTSSRLLGNFYEVHTTRQLTELEQYISVTGTSIFTWKVYESSSQTGTYTEIFTKTVSSSGQDQFHSSGAIDVTLTAGKFYFIGVHVGGSFGYAYNSPQPTYPSFGRSFASRYVSGTTPPTSVTSSTSSLIYYQRLTTAR